MDQFERQFRISQAADELRRTGQTSTSDWEIAAAARAIHRDSQADRHLDAALTNMAIGAMSPILAVFAVVAVIGTILSLILENWSVIATVVVLLYGSIAAITSWKQIMAFRPALGGLGILALTGMAFAVKDTTVASAEPLWALRLWDGGPAADGFMAAFLAGFLAIGVLTWPWTTRWEGFPPLIHPLKALAGIAAIPLPLVMWQWLTGDGMAFLNPDWTLLFKLPAILLIASALWAFMLMIQKRAEVNSPEAIARRIFPD